MVAAHTSGPGLSPADLDRIRDILASGRKPKVSFTKAAGQIAGQIGQVVALTDPAESDEWVVVRFGRDELPFAPTDLAVAPKGASARKAVPAQPTPETAPEPAPEATPPSPREEPPMAPPTPPADSAPTPPAAPTAPPPPRNTRKAARAKQTPTLTVTLVYNDGEWLVSATQGGKTLAKPYIVKPSEALAMVAMLDVPSVHEAVEEIVETARAEARSQAERLRAELAEVEARLMELGKND